MHFMGRMSKGIEFERQEKMKWIWYNNRFLHHNSTGKFKEENTEILGKFYFFCNLISECINVLSLHYQNILELKNEKTIKIINSKK